MGLHWVDGHLDKTNTNIVKEHFRHTIDKTVRWISKAVVFRHRPFIHGWESYEVFLKNGTGRAIV